MSSDMYQSNEAESTDRTVRSVSAIGEAILTRTWDSFSLAQSKQPELHNGVEL